MFLKCTLAFEFFNIVNHKLFSKMKISFKIFQTTLIYTLVNEEKKIECILLKIILAKDENFYFHTSNEGY